MAPLYMAVVARGGQTLITMPVARDIKSILRIIPRRLCLSEVGRRQAVTTKPASLCKHTNGQAPCGGTGKVTQEQQTGPVLAGLALRRRTTSGGLERAGNRTILCKPPESGVISS